MIAFKRNIAGVLLIALAGSAAAQLSLSDKMYMRMERGVNPDRHDSGARVAGRLPDITLGFIKIAPGFDRAALESEGVHVSTVRGDIALVSVRTADVDRVASLPCVERMEVSRRIRATMDKARAVSGVDLLHAGELIDHPYTGKGVIAGIVDEGLDANHINFRNDDGTSRLGYLGHIYLDQSAQGGWNGTTYDRDNIWRFTTDTETTFHATHTLGILGGGYKGKIEAAIEQADKSAPIQTVDNPYYGVAVGADLAAGVCPLYDQLIAQSIDQMLNYRWDEDKPMVLSLSLGSNINSHSPNALIGQFLDKVAEETLVVISAGNEGDIPLAVIKTLTESDREVKTFIRSIREDGRRYGMCQIFSDKPFTLKAVTYNRARGRVAANFPVVEGTEDGAGTWYCSSADFKENDTDIVSTLFANAFNGYLGVGYDIDKYSKEHMALVSYYTENAATNIDDNYLLGFIVEGEPGQRIECYNEVDYGELSNFGIAGWDDGTSDGSISDMACGHDVLVVGAYNTRDSYGSLEGLVRNYQGKFTPGLVTPFSSYGTLADGRKLPHVCAPGAAVISSTSSYYEEAQGVEYINTAALSARLDEPGRRNYWAPASGTSMATPYVAGSIALWLEADPTLTIDDVKDIISATAVRDADVEAGNPVQWGAGKFDAYAGLKEVLRRSSGIGAIDADSSGLMLRQEGSSIELFIAGAGTIDASVYSTAGARLLAASATGDQLTVDTSALVPGIYILTVNKNHSRKIIVSNSH